MKKLPLFLMLLFVIAACGVDNEETWEEYRDWKHGSFKHRCSECGYHDNERDDLGTYNYCPHCGAQMLPEPPKEGQTDE